MKNTTFAISLLLCIGGLSLIASAADESPSEEIPSPTLNKSSAKNEPGQGDALGKRTEQGDYSLVREATDRQTPPWTNDSANINNHQPRTSPNKFDEKPYSPSDLTVKQEWKKIFANDDHFSTTTGKELYKSMCQACHMPDGQGAQGAGVYPSFVGNERLRSPDYPIDVILNGLRGMPPFGDKLSNQQIADVVNYLRTDLGNKLVGDTTGQDVARVRH